MEGLLLEQGIPSLVRRTGGFDVPDFLAAGPRDILVPATGAALARELLGTHRAGRARSGRGGHARVGQGARGRARRGDRRAHRGRRLRRRVLLSRLQHEIRARAVLG